jgi:hypothetical protein
MLTCGIHNTHALLHGLLRRSFPYSYTKPRVNFICRSAVILLRYAVLYARCSTVSSASGCTSVNTLVPSPRGCISRPNTQLSNNSYHDNDGVTAGNPHRTHNPVTMAVTTTRVWLTYMVLNRDFLNAELNITERRPSSFAALQLMSSALRRAVKR